MDAHHLPSATDLRQQGNYLFQQKDYPAAVQLYTAALEKSAHRHDDDDINEGERILNLCNRSACYYLMEEYEHALQDAEQAYATSNETNLKAAYRLVKTLIALQLWERAKNVIQQQQNLLDDNGKDKELFQELWNQVLQGALTDSSLTTNTTTTTTKPETSIKFVKRPISIKEFTLSTELGCGNFSEIRIATHKMTHEVFALKIIEKKKAADLAKRQHPNVYNEIAMERRVLLERLPPTSLFIVRTYHAFQDYNSLYFLMELHDVWPDLWKQLRYDNVMVGCHRSQGVIWMDQLVDAVEHMHRHGIVHRDLKPENILLSNHGHVVVIDFGTAKDLLHTDLNGPEFVGTPDLMSPEAVSGTSGASEVQEADARQDIGATHGADLWALGAILFLLETGHVPFWSPSPYLAFLKIKRCLLRRSAGIVDDATWDLIHGLMQYDPSERLGADAFELVVKNDLSRTIRAKPGGYDSLRQHAYFRSCRENEKLKYQTPIPSLRDLCYRAVADRVVTEAHDLDLCDAHPPGDGSKHDVLRLSPRDRSCVMHILDRQKNLRDPRIYDRFVQDPVAARLDKVRPETRDFVGLTQMNDDQGKAVKATMNDPYAEPVAVRDLEFVHLTNPLFVQPMNESANEETRKGYIKLLRKCIARINRTRPVLVVVTGFVDTKCRKLLSRISDSIPVVIADGSAFFAFWEMGVQCIALSSHTNVQEDSDQMAWLREQLEQVRLSKHPLFVFTDTDPKSLPPILLKRLARGRTLALYGITEGDTYETSLAYQANETVDDVSVKSNDSDEDTERDSFVMKICGTLLNGLRCITVDPEPDSWRAIWQEIGLDE